MKVHKMSFVSTVGVSMTTIEFRMCMCSGQDTYQTYEVLHTLETEVYNNCKRTTHQNLTCSVNVATV